SARLLHAVSLRRAAPNTRSRRLRATPACACSSATPKRSTKRSSRRRRWKRRKREHRVSNLSRSLTQRAKSLEKSNGEIGDANYVSHRAERPEEKMSARRRQAARAVDRRAVR